MQGAKPPDNQSSSPLIPAIDPQLTELAVRFSFAKLTYVSGEVEMCYSPSLLDEQMDLIKGLLRALSQKPPQQEVESWLTFIRETLCPKCSANPSNRLIFTYKPFQTPFGGLPAGFEMKFTTREANADSIITEINTPNLPLERLILARGQLRMPALPSLISQHLQQIERILKALKQDLTTAEIEAWGKILEPKLQELFQASPNTFLEINYEPLNPSLGLAGGVNLSITGDINTIEDYYYEWTQVREGPLFGGYPDAKVVDTIAQLGEPSTVPVLDIGAGTGRNSIALAKAGYPVDALELTQVLTERLVETAKTEHLPLNVIWGDIFSSNLILPLAPYKFIILAEVIASHFRSGEQVRQLMHKLCEILQPGGMILFNLFLAVDSYELTPAVREMAQVYWSFVMTRQELQTTLEGLPLKIVTDESVFEYEKEHLPVDGWPPTPWFISWSTGRNVFPIEGKPPLELCWLLCVKV